MTKYCVVCKKRYVPGDTSSRFHDFPKDKERKSRWMQIIGISSVTKNIRVCGDHFESSSYHSNEDYRSNLKKLLSTAVPNLNIRPPSDIANVQASPNQNSSIVNVVKAEPVDEETCYRICECRKNVDDASCHFPNKKVFSSVNNLQDDCKTNLDFQKTIEQKNIQPENTKIQLDTVLKRESTDNHLQIHPAKQICLVSDANLRSTVNENVTAKSNIETRLHEAEFNRNLKRKCLSKDDVDALSRTIKKFRWKDGTCIKGLIRQDFTSDKAWNNFLKFTVLKRQQNEALRKKCERRVNRINSLKDMIKALKIRGERRS